MADNKKKKTAEELELLRKRAESNIRERLETYDKDDHPERVHTAELFNLSGVTIPDCLWTGKYEGLSLEAKVLYSFIRRRAFQSKEAHFTEDGFIFVKMSQAEMMQITGKKTPNTIRKITGELEAVGLIDIEKQEDMCSVRKIFLHHIFREDGTPLLEMDKDDTKKARAKHRDYQRRTKKEVMGESRKKQKEKKEREIEAIKAETLKEFALRLYPEYLKRLQAAGVDINLYHIATKTTEELYKVFEAAGVCCNITDGTREFYEDHSDKYKVGGWHEDIEVDWSLIKAAAEREGKEGEAEALDRAVRTAALLLNGWEDEAAEWHEEHKSEREKKEEERKARDRQKAEARIAKAKETRRRNQEVKAKKERESWNSEEAQHAEYEAYKRELVEEEELRKQEDTTEEEWIDLEEQEREEAKARAQAIIDGMHAEEERAVPEYDDLFYDDDEEEEKEKYWFVGSKKEA